MLLLRRFAGDSVAAFGAEGGVRFELGATLLALFGCLWLWLLLLQGIAAVRAEGVICIIEGLAVWTGNLLGLRGSCGCILGRALWLGTPPGLAVDRGINCIVDLGLQARLANESGASSDHQGPEEEHTYRANRGLIEPLMLSDRGGNASLHSLQRDGERGLEADQPLNLAPLADLDRDLIACAKVLHLVSLLQKLAFQVACQALKIELGQGVEAIIHGIFPLFGKFLLRTSQRLLRFVGKRYTCATYLTYQKTQV